jgi:ATP-dependent RNA helicase RhlE
MYYVDKDDKKKLLVHLLEDKSIERVLVFARTKHGSDKIVKDLHKYGIAAEAIHGNKSQNARQRALSNFKSGTTRVLVATDIAARGIDVDNLTHVINYELPNVPETYVHRIGRTGRAGASGIAFSFCDHEEREFLRDIQKLIGNSIPVVDNHPHAMEISSMDIRRTLPQRPQGQQGRRSYGSSERTPQRNDFSERPAQRSFSSDRAPQRTGASKIVLRKAN